MLALLSLALWKRPSRPFAAVLAWVMVVDALCAESGLFRTIQWIDALAVWPLVLLTARNVKWWSVTCSLASMAVLPMHLWFWKEYDQGVDVRQIYKVGANVLFVLSLLALVAGNTNVRELKLELHKWLDSLRDRGRALAYSRVGRAEAATRTEGPLDEPVCTGRRRNARLGRRVSGRFGHERVNRAWQTKAP